MPVNLFILQEKADALIKCLQDDCSLATRFQKEVDQHMEILEVENKTLQFERERNLDLQHQFTDDSSRFWNKSTKDKEALYVVIQNVKKNIDNLNNSSQELDKITKIVKEQVSCFTTISILATENHFRTNYL
jgi:hypothetical protein